MLQSQGLWDLLNSSTLVGHGLAVGAAILAADVLLTAIGRLPTFWARRGRSGV